MSTLANQIEAYLKRLLAEHNGVIELKRGDLAEAFTCVPSQINYVLETRFSTQQGYIVESRRGGGGYIRVVRLSLGDADILGNLLKQKEREVNQQTAELLIKRLVEEEILTNREGMIINALLDRNVLEGHSANVDALRGDMLNTLLLSLLREDFA